MSIFLRTAADLIVEPETPDLLQTLANNALLPIVILVVAVVATFAIIKMRKG